MPDLDGDPLAVGPQQLRDEIKSLVVQQRLNILINLLKVAHIDSGGLEELCRCLTTVSKADGKLKLENLTSKNEHQLSITRLVTVFDTFDNEAESVQRFG